jgi:hypothetical protein
LFTVAGILLAIWQFRIERQTTTPGQSSEPPEWVPQLAQAIKQAGQPVPDPTPPLPESGPIPPRPKTDEGTGYDVFISYSHADKDWVRGELLKSLEDQGLRVCIDFRDFRPGASKIKEIERAVLASC